MKGAKTDANQTDIVQALRDAYVSVFVSSDTGRGFPDIVCGFRGSTYLLEIKTGAGKLTPAQEEFHATWRGHLVTVRTVDEALRAVGVLR